MGKLTRRAERPLEVSDPLAAGAVSVISIAAGAVVGILVHMALARLSIARGHDVYEARLLGPVALGALAAGLVGGAARPRGGPWPLAISSALLSGGYAAARVLDSQAEPRTLVFLGAVVAAVAVVGAFGTIAGWMDRRRRASRPTWPRTIALALACATGVAALAPYGLAPVATGGFDLAVRLGERQLPTVHAPPLGLVWAVAAVLVAASTRLPWPVLLLAGVGGASSAASALLGGATPPDWLAMLAAAARAVAWVVATGLVLQAMHELRESDARRPLVRTAPRRGRRREGPDRPRPRPKDTPGARHPRNPDPRS